MHVNEPSRTAWSTGVEQVHPDVWRIPLPLPNDALRAVNVYAVYDGGDLVLIDGGWALADSEELLARSLAGIGLGLGDITEFLVTHVHRDHYSQAVAIRAKFGARVRLGADEKPNVVRAGDDSTARPGLPAFLRRCGAAEIADQLEAQGNERMFEILEEPDNWLADGEVVSAGSRRLRTIATPGHTRGHVVYSDPAANVLFAGDHVLPHITPSIGLQPNRVPFPLRDYLASLRLLLDLPDAQLLPAHGPITASVHARVHELIAHHEQRLDATETAITANAGSSLDAAQQLTWTRRETALQDLDLFNQSLAIAETKAHLDVLVLQGRATLTTGTDGVDFYQPS
jgi:glyoxylase-like metal-dependent hydrolase (beta-lactamase superfamily II)